MRAGNVLLTILFSSCSSLFAQETVDLLIRNGRIIDGTGNSWYQADLAVKRGRISHIGRRLILEAKQEIDARGMVIAPGFIDVHAHIEGSIFERPTADNYLYDGVTTVVTGNCGGSADDVGDFLRHIDSIRTSVNVATLAGHNTLRRQAMGLVSRPPDPAEQVRMEALMDSAMREGAVGLSTGLIYLPGMYAATEEIVGLAKVASAHGGVYATHMRNEGLRVTEAIEEALTIGKQASVPVQISHFKLAGRASWGKSTITLDMVKAAREGGLDVTIDQYPYTASSTNLATTVPGWALEGGLDSLRLRVKDPETYKRIQNEMVRKLKESRYRNFGYAVVAQYVPDTSLNGKTISAINRMKGRPARPAEEAATILEMLQAGNAQMVFHSMDEKDLVHFISYPFNMPAADGGVSNGRGMPHPRSYGTNARVLARYVREQRLITLEEAIRRMTSLPAQKFGFQDRGLLKEGFIADIVILDPALVADQATFENPHQFSVGIPWVIVQGEPVIREGRHTGIRSGQAIRHRSQNPEP